MAHLHKSLQGDVTSFHVWLKPDRHMSVQKQYYSLKTFRIAKHQGEYKKRNPFIGSASQCNIGHVGNHRGH